MWVGVRPIIILYGTGVKGNVPLDDIVFARTLDVRRFAFVGILFRTAACAFGGRMHLHCT